MLNIWVATDWHLYNEELRDPRHPYRTIDNISKLSDNYGSAIQESDTFIFLGDLCDPTVSDLKKVKDTLGTIQGHKIMTKGNHDTEPDNFYLELGFDEVCDVCLMGKLVFSHSPMKIKPDQINVHGHLHMRKDSRLNSQYVNAYDPEHRDHPYLLDDLLEYAAKQYSVETKENAQEVYLDNYESVDGSFTAANILDITDRMSLLGTLIDESVAELTAVSQLKTPKELSTWMKRNIHYGNMTTIKSTAQMIKSKVGSCHDQVAFAFPYLRDMGVQPRILFFIAVNPGTEKGGMTHSLIYWGEEHSDKITWFENAWSGQAGIHEFENMTALKNTIKELYSKTSGAKEYPELVFKNTNIKHFKEGYTLKQLVDSIMNNKLLESTYDDDDGECDIAMPEVYITGGEEFGEKCDVYNYLKMIMNYANPTLEVINISIVRDNEHTLDYEFVYYSDDTAANVTIYYPLNIQTDRYPIEDALKYALAGVIIHNSSKKTHDYNHPMLYLALAAHIFDDYNPYVNTHHECAELDKYVRVVTHLEEKYGHLILSNLINGEVNFQDLLIQLAMDETASDPLDEVLFQSVADTEYFEQDDDYKPGSKKKDPMVEREPVEEKIDIPAFYAALKKRLAEQNDPVDPTEVIHESAVKNDKGEEVPEVCPKCGAPVKIFLRGEPVYLCTNKKCGKYFGTVPCNVNEDTAQLHGINREVKTELSAKYGIRNVGQTHDANDEDPEDPIDKKQREQEEKKQEAEKKRQEKLKRLEKARRVKKRKDFVRKVKSKLPFKKKDSKNEDSTDFDWMKMTEDNPIWGERLQVFDSPTQYQNETGYKFQLQDKLWFNEEPITESAASGDEKLYPVYIMLVHSGTALATAIKVVTQSHFSHSSISFDSSMHNMYSFGRKRGVNPAVGAFVKEDIRDKFFTDRTIPFALYVVPSTKSEVALMKKRLDYFIKNATKFDYDFTGLFKNYFGIADNPEYKWFCSRFVADIVNAGRPSSEPYVVEPSLMKPEDFQNTNFAIYVCGGYINSYDSDFVDRVTKRILRAEQMRRASLKKANAVTESAIYDLDPYDPYQKNVLEYQLATMDEAVLDTFLQYLRSFKVRFDKDGNVIITRREMDQLDEHFRQAVKNVKAYQNAGNVVGVKDELCKVYYMIELINHYYLNSKVQQNRQIKTDIRKEMLDLRSVMLNMFQQNLKYVTVREPQFNFQAYYDQSKYGKNTEIPKSVLSAIGKTIVTSLK